MEDATTRKIEPKTFFANERTFLSWLHTAITLASISVALLAFGQKTPAAQISGIILLPISIVFILYALYVFYWRAEKIRLRDGGPYDDRFGPKVLAIVLVLALTSNFVVNLAILQT